MRKFWVVPAAALIILFSTGFEGRGLAGPPGVARDFGRMPLYFIPNQGQLDARVACYLQGKDKIIYFAADGLTFALNGQGCGSGEQAPEDSGRRPAPESPRPGPRGAGRYVVKLDFIGANAGILPSGEGETGAVISYFRGKPEEWRAGLPTYSKIVYRGLWPGIDLACYGTANKLKYDFVVHPGADPSLIRLAYRGASQVEVNGEGRLVIKTPEGGFEDDSPLGYQVIDGQRVDVALKYRLDEPAGSASGSGPSAGADTSFAYGFDVGAYDRSRPLVLDPAVRVYCGYIGGSSADGGSDIAVDAKGCAYVTGTTLSSQATFPVKVGPDVTHNGGDIGYDAFVAKVNPSGSGLVYCGYIGGKKDDHGRGIAVDGKGNAYITGFTDSEEAYFPVKVGPDLTHNGGDDAFVAKVNPSGTALVYCGYIGGSSYDDRGRDIAVDGYGCAYVVGSAYSTEATFPVKVGPDLTHNGGDDAFVAKVNPSGSGLVYCGYIGGADTDHGLDVAVDSLGNAYVSGATSTSQATFPVKVGPDLTYNGGVDGFVAKVNRRGSALVYCGYIGGSGDDEVHGLAVDSSGRAFVAGTTNSSQATFPVKIGPDLTHNGVHDAYVAKISASGGSLVYCGYIGGSSEDYGRGLAVDKWGNAYVTGDTSSNSRTFPVKNGPDSSYNGVSDAFVAKVNAAGAALVYCGYIGGAERDTAQDIAVDASGSAYVTGWTGSSQATFPVKAGPDLTWNGGDDAFVIKIKMSMILGNRR
jgi:hypothetical protein